jgi:acetoin:2,6-dichlorophenolindophenol oxidoreductase subunit beta
VFSREINRAFKDAIIKDSNVLICGQLVYYGQAGNITSELPRSNLVQFPCAEALQNSATLGLALAGKRPVMIHERMEFMMVGGDALINFIPVWPGVPLVIVAVVGKGKGQGPQQSKDLTYWFRSFENWTVRVPESPAQAYEMMMQSIFGNGPVLYVAHRELFDLNEGKRLTVPESVRLCGASERHEREFYMNNDPSISATPIQPTANASVKAASK